MEAKDIKKRGGTSGEQGSQKDRDGREMGIEVPVVVVKVSKDYLYAQT